MANPTGRKYEGGRLLPVAVMATEDDLVIPVQTQDIVNVRTQEVAVPAANPLVGQIVIAMTGTAVHLPANVLPTSSVLIYALTDNTTAGTVGGPAVTNTVDGTGNGYILEAGQSVVVMVDDLGDVWVNGTAGDIFTYSAG